MLHGGLGHSRDWLPQLEGLSNEFTVVAWDAPGSGDSADPPSGFTAADYGDCLAAFLRALGLVRPHVLGLSWGSVLALELYRRHPKIPAALLLASAYAGWAGSLPAEVVQRRTEQVLREVDLPPQDFLPGWIPTLLTEQATPELVADVTAVMSEFHPAGARVMFEAFAAADYRPVLPTIAIPTLLLYGELDRRSPLSVARDLHDRIPGSTLVDQRRRAPQGEADLISLLLAARDPQTGAPLSTQDVRDQVLIFLLAGHESTSTALTFTAHLLGHHPDQQRRVHAEIDTVLGGRTPTADDIGNLTYTTMAIKEATRLYPPAHTLGRVTPTGDQIGGYPIPPGSVVLLSPWVTHRRPDLWPDPHRFDPERFHPTAAATQHRYAYLPFAGGARGCIGEHFAMTEAIAATAVLLNAYTLHTTPAPIPLNTGITLRPDSPVHARITPRPRPSAQPGKAPG